MHVTYSTILLLAVVLFGCDRAVDEYDNNQIERERVRKEYGVLFDQVAAILFEDDPIGINFEVNTDEYEPEVGTILPRLTDCSSALEVRRVVHEEFVRWFDEETAGPESRYTAAAERIWEVWIDWQER